MIQGSPIAETPRDALELRRKLLRWWAILPGPAAKWVEAIEPPGRSSRDTHDSFGQWLALHQQSVLADGDLYLVSDEMTEVTRAAALTLPAFAIEREDFPSEKGLIVFHHPTCTMKNSKGEVADLVAATWWMGFDRGAWGVWFCFYEDRDGGKLAPSVANGPAIRAANKTLMPRLLWQNYCLVPLGEDFSSGLAVVPMIPHVLSAFLLMQQPLASREKVRPLPADSRRASRVGITDTSVTVVKLRHLKSAFEHGVARPREWRHRWIVRGHWRNQWLPSRAVHRPTWISPHIKGPDEMPLKVTEKVNVWAR
jgi:hypothetical protein